MKEIRLAIFGAYCDAQELSETKSAEAVFKFSPPKDGYLMLGEYALAVKGGVCKGDLRALDDGEFSAFFYTDSTMYTLPRMKKVGRKISVLPPDADHVIELAARCREMGGRLSELDESVKELDGLIRGGILAIGESDE